MDTVGKVVFIVMGRVGVIAASGEKACETVPV